MKKSGLVLASSKWRRKNGKISESKNGSFRRNNFKERNLKGSMQGGTEREKRREKRG